MVRIRWVAAVLLVLTGALLAGTALAGGWAIVKLDALPNDVVAGEPVSIGFTVLQHGRTPAPGLNPLIKAVHVPSGETIEGPARAQGEPGHYVAEITLPVSGSWSWSINAYSGDHPMPPLTVLSPEISPASADTQPASNGRVSEANLGAPSSARWAAIGLGLSGLALITTAGIFSIQRRRWVPAREIASRYVTESSSPWHRANARGGRCRALVQDWRRA
ncbi:MAG: hypothetical protein HY682_07165 [Chloroflexi bacterium]|nr:hypothetical protein [Chloroflexota bacterium]